MKDVEVKIELLSKQNIKLCEQMENAEEILSQHEAYIRLLENENQQLKGYNEYLRNIIKECEPYIENVCTALNMEKFANGDFLHKSNEVLSKIRNAIGEK